MAMRSGALHLGLRLAAALAALLVLTVLSLALVLRWKRELPPEPEQDRIYALAIAAAIEHWKGNPKFAFERPTEEGPQAAALGPEVWDRLETGESISCPAFYWRGLLTALSPANELGYGHSFPSLTTSPPLELVGETQTAMTLRLSRIGFDWRRTRAVVVVEACRGFRPHGLIGFTAGLSIFLERGGDGSWRILRKEVGWVS